MKNKPIYALADDFSGASEIAGIGFRYGLSTRVLPEPNSELKFSEDLIVCNTNTRLKSAEVAAKIVQHVSRSVNKACNTPHFFKKIDSVLRGPIVPEARTVLEELGYDRTVLLPANPSKGRIIQDGHYYIDGQPLDETQFRNDPELPRTTSDVASLLNGDDGEAQYRHISDQEDWPAGGIFSVDLTSLEDVRRQVGQLQPGDFCCGGADAFEAFLNHLKLTQGGSQKKTTSRGLTVIMNGSTYQRKEEEKKIHKLGIPVSELGDYFSVKNGARLLADEIIDKLTTHSRVFIKVGMPLMHDDSVSQKIEAMFAKLSGIIIQEKLDREGFHLYLTGGSTATSVIKELNINAFRVVDEAGPGIVTLGASDLNGYITTKPGSYPWPEHIFLD